MDNNIENLTKRIIDLRDARDWKQFHNPKDVALSLVLEAGEVMEHFQWKNTEEMAKYVQTNKSTESTLRSPKDILAEISSLDTETTKILNNIKKII